MLQIDGKPVDLTNPASWGDSIKIMPNGFIEQRKDGMTTRVEAHQDSSKSPESTRSQRTLK